MKYLGSITDPKDLVNKEYVDDVSDMIADEYGSSSTYAVGDYCIYNGDLYRCTTAITTAEAWTASHWTQVVIGSEITNINNVLDYEGYLTNNGNYQITADILEFGQWSYSTKADNTSRARSKFLLPVRVGMQISYVNTTFDVYFGVLATPTSSTYTQTIGWKTDSSGTVNITKDGYMTFVIRNHADTTVAVDPADFDGIVIITTDIGNNIILKYTGTAPTTSVTELPDNCWWVVSGSVLRGLVGENFIWDLVDDISYIVKKINLRFPSGYRRYEICAVAGSIYWTGGKTEAGTSINWYTTKPDTALTASNVPADAKTVGDKITGIDKFIKENTKENEFELYTEFTLEDGWWKTNGTLEYIPTQSHTQKLKIRPNTTYYFSVMPTLTDAFGALFDEAGNFVSTLSINDSVTEYTYNIPNADPDSTLTDYVKLYQITMPENCAYISINWLKTDPKKASVDYSNRFDIYRNFLSSKPIFALMNTGNYQIKHDDATYQKYKSRKLCIIGSSPVMIDRLYREGNNHEYVVGFQEYLMPWWSEVSSFGYSSASYRKYDVADGASTRSIYSRVITDQLDLSGYDDYLLVANGNGVTGHIGTLTSYDDLGDATEVMGGMRQIVDYIYQQNPDAMIYVQTMRYQGSWATTGRETANQLNAEIRNMAGMLSLGLVDNAYDSGINQYNSSRLSYDGGSHCNQIGNKIMGLCVRKSILGF